MEFILIRLGPEEVMAVQEILLSTGHFAVGTTMLW